MRILLFFAAFSLFSAPVPIQDPEEITYEWLIEQGKETGYSDHIPHFRELFDREAISHFLEFGVGYSTKYFLDRCDEVVSVEFVVDGAGPGFMKEMMRLYSGISRWVPSVFFSAYEGETGWAPYQYVGTGAVSQAAFVQCSTHKTYAWVDAGYLEELNDFINSLVCGYAIDAAFVDPGIYLRGDLVQLLFGKVPIIVAHDTNDRKNKVIGDPYGYSRIDPPSEYEEIHISSGQGTTFWILKTARYDRLIEGMKQYAQ